MSYNVTISLPEDIAPYAKELANQRVLSQIIANLLTEYRDKMGMAYHVDTTGITIEDLKDMNVKEVEGVKIQEILNTKDDIKAYIKILLSKRNQYGSPMSNYEAKLTVETCLKLVAVKLKVSDEELDKWLAETKDITEYVK